MTVISGDKLKVRNVNVDEDGVQKAVYQTAAAWYDDQPGQEDYFLLLDTEEYQGLAAANGQLRHKLSGAGVCGKYLLETFRQFS